MLPYTCPPFPRKVISNHAATTIESFAAESLFPLTKIQRYRILLRLPENGEQSKTAILISWTDQYSYSVSLPNTFSAQQPVPPSPETIIATESTHIGLPGWILLILGGIGAGGSLIFLWFKKRHRGKPRQLTQPEPEASLTRKRDALRKAHYHLRLLDTEQDETDYNILHLHEIIGQFIASFWDLDLVRFSSTQQRLLFLEQQLSLPVSPAIRHHARVLLISLQKLRYAKLSTEERRRLFAQTVTAFRELLDLHQQDLALSQHESEPDHHHVT
ncbi:MAG: hypothetical protein D6820_14265 [Lentisphaerae bacterium]|nr:MAG: hypothetical protein D6820_14265 [Lentisphaerota bacterium]